MQANYLREAALAHDPPSKTVYDPERDGIRCRSLGVHEHWNNGTDKKYSRNLGKAHGIKTFPGQLKSRIHLSRRCVAQFRNWRSFTKLREGRVARSATNPQQSNGSIRFLCIA